MYNAWNVGLLRKPVLLSPPLTAEEIGIENYEISLTEPMHDLKNLITHILTELPHHIEDSTLQKVIKEFCGKVLSK